MAGLVGALSCAPQIRFQVLHWGFDSSQGNLWEGEEGNKQPGEDTKNKQTGTAKEWDGEFSIFSFIKFKFFTKNTNHSYNKK